MYHVKKGDFVNVLHFYTSMEFWHKTHTHACIHALHTVTHDVTLVIVTIFLAAWRSAVWILSSLCVHGMVGSLEQSSLSRYAVAKSVM